MVVNIDPAPAQVADVEELTHTFTGLPPGEMLEVYIVPTNTTGDGHHSPSANVVIP